MSKKKVQLIVEPFLLIIFSWFYNTCGILDMLLLQLQKLYLSNNKPNLVSALLRLRKNVDQLNGSLHHNK